MHRIGKTVVPEKIFDQFLEITLDGRKRG